MPKTRILLGVTGGIAAFKAIDLASKLYKLGYEVKCVLTENALQFVRPASFAAITHNSIHLNMFNDPDPIVHISLADWADIIVVAPATANIIAKAAHGIGDDLLSTIFLAHTKPILFVPAMNVHMLESAPTQDNLTILKHRKHHILQPSSGMLACGYEGQGKYPPNEEIVAAINTFLNYQNDLSGTKVLITAGATIEAIDPMRFISNRSSGKMGLALARALALRGAEVCLVYGHIEATIPHYLTETIFAESADSMREAVLSRYKDVDWIIKCAAVADYKPLTASTSKLPKCELNCIDLISTPDILQELGTLKLPHQKLIGFAAQTDDLLDKALDKYKRKNLDMICVNNIEVAGSDDSEITLIGKLPGQASLPEAPELSYLTINGNKFSLAHRIVDNVKTL
ncbi:MAG: bifunctional phosphopantothenoylcysteine decarboxylase/phosphopantothenate--cysteine ligase CoaBC [Candidatus Cloacimonetes bacterium HGW-Cloacimonetes-3]|jgi:phosphopantothenoylcysteine decarboxylase/phosphopantothenate--cysteine ligase|nr:MAG: bifunctional phosphopantothenoylcysteine decarboxylase/phosphopantothenate--cysteine ligase CoaBC [Candidatus Cloacimonetes bacterium HGW-Cloacimonetes-3]